ncbi:hypothetical protein CPB83DRAFT_840515 [Crepidotus variabilis]|uniref:Uncharacterized protein n=1 Tax=Crepidotus variabilis TaxID=179855 RepID=A0A9P6JIZ6_9AGAR|nr:hypothetical protein CPB83DRAFT_840515 [Crepidotus variabilis]
MALPPYHRQPHLHVLDSCILPPIPHQLPTILDLLYPSILRHPTSKTQNPTSKTQNPTSKTQNPKCELDIKIDVKTQLECQYQCQSRCWANAKDKAAQRRIKSSETDAEPEKQEGGGLTMPSSGAQVVEIVYAPLSSCNLRGDAQKRTLDDGMRMVDSTLRTSSESVGERRLTNWNRIVWLRVGMAVFNVQLLGSTDGWVNRYTPGIFIKQPNWMQSLRLYD